MDSIIKKIERYVDERKLLDKNLLFELKKVVGKITQSQEEYAIVFAKNETIKNDSIKRKERIKNIDLELENWKSLKSNSEKMNVELQNRKNKLKIEIEDNEKKSEKIATNKGQIIQNLENTKRRSNEIDLELGEAEKKYNSINKNINEIQEKLSSLRENKARNEATIEGIDSRKKDLMYAIKNELNIENESLLLTSSDLSSLSEDDLPTMEEQEKKVEKIRKSREALGSVNLRADEETKKYEEEIKKMEDDRADLYSAIVKLKSSIEELNQKGRERLMDAFTKSK